MNRNAIPLLACTFITLVVPAVAASTQTWTASTAEELARGQLEGTALDPRGRVVLAPRLESVWGPAAGIVWELEPLADGAVALAMSGPGRLVILPAGEGEEIHHEIPDEGLVTAVAEDAAGGILFGISPAGTVQRVVGDGDAAPLLETSAKFIWALEVDAAGDIWIGTGLPGGLWRARPGGELESVYESGDDPVRCITPLPGGGVVFGTGGKGRVIRASKNGELFVLLDADEKEVVAITVDDQSRIHVLTADSAKQVQASTDPRIPAGAVRVVARPSNGNGNGDGNGGDDGGDDGEESGEAPPARPVAPVQQFRAGSGGALYRIDAEGSRRLWETVDAMPFDMLADGESMLLATGDQGHLIRVDAEGRAAVVARLPSKQASSLGRATDGSVLVAGTTDARVARLSAESLSEGVYLSATIDAQRPADWGRVRLGAEIPRGARLRLRARSGNTDQPDTTWSPWTPLNESGVAQAPTARWMQLEARFEAKRGGSPALRRLEVDFVPQNRAPAILTLEVQPPGVVWIPGPAQTANRLGPLVADDPVARGTASSLTSVRMNPVRRGYETGARTVSWSTDDADGDRLVHVLEIQQEDSERWHVIADELVDSFFSWDARWFPSGRYRVRLRADDYRDNAVGRNLKTEKVSAIFEIDNDRPQVEELKARPAANGLDVAFLARDPGGRVRAAEIRLDGGSWQPLDPLDGIADSDQERYRIVLKKASAAATIQVRVTDAGGNLGGAFWGP